MNGLQQARPFAKGPGLARAKVGDRASRPNLTAAASRPAHGGHPCRCGARERLACHHGRAERVEFPVSEQSGVRDRGIEPSDGGRNRAGKPRH